MIYIYNYGHNYIQTYILCSTYLYDMTYHTIYIERLTNHLAAALTVCVGTTRSRSSHVVMEMKRLILSFVHTSAQEDSLKVFVGNIRWGKEIM